MPIIEANNIIISKSDIDSLGSKQWLTDNIIFAFFNCFKEQKNIFLMEYFQISKILNREILNFDIVMRLFISRLNILKKL
jgi:hypothetical protein